jgi:hypothetical protein
VCAPLNVTQSYIDTSLILAADGKLSKNHLWIVLLLARSISMDRFFPDTSPLALHPPGNPLPEL